MTPAAGSLLAQEGAETGQELFLLGDDFMPWMVLAFGAAMVVGNLLALLRPPKSQGTTPRGGSGARAGTRTAPAPRPPLARSLVMIAIGLLAAGWGLASLLS